MYTRSSTCALGGGAGLIALPCCYVPPPPFFLEVHVCCKMEEGGVTASQYGNTYYSGNGELATLAKCGNLCMIVHVIALPFLYCRK